MLNRNLRHKISFARISFDSVRLGILLVGIIALWGIVYLGLNSEATITGQRVHDLQDKLDRISHENAQLEYDIAALLQPSRMAERATALGLRPATISQTVYFNVKNYPTSAASVTYESQPTTRKLRPSDLTSWWNDLLARVGLGGGLRAAEATTNQ